MSKNIPSPAIRRLPRYYRYLGELSEQGVSRISSKELSEKMKVTPSQIRQDLNSLGCIGQQGFGYSVEQLYNEIKVIMGLDRQYNVIIIGAGNIGQALVSYQNFANRGFSFKAMFDVNPKIIGLNIHGVDVLDADDLEDYLKSNNIDIGVLALPKSNAKKMADVLINNGVKGIWNFSHIDIETKNDVVVENAHLTDSLMRLSYKLNNDFNMMDFS